MSASFEGRKMLANVTFKQMCFWGCFFTHQSWPPRTFPDNFWGKKIDLKTSKNQLDATAPTENTMNWLKCLKNIKIFLDFYQHFQKFKNGKSVSLLEYLYEYLSEHLYETPWRTPSRTPLSRVARVPHATAAGIPRDDFVPSERCS